MAWSANGWSLQFHRPDVSTKFFETVNDPSLRRGKPDLQWVSPEIREQRAGTGMEMLDGKGWIYRNPAVGMQPLRPDASKAVALGDEIQQIAIRRPGGSDVYVRAARNGNPVRFAS